MATKTVPINQLASAVMEGLEEYAKLATHEVKESVKKVSREVQKDISASAPRRTGRYAKSWRTKTTREDSTGIVVTVYSPTRYMLAHLLEHGHAKRGGGRVSGRPHIGPAEEKGNRNLENEIKRKLGRL